MDYPRYRPQRLRPPGKGAFSDFATTVLNGTLQAVRRTRRSRAERKVEVLAPKEVEG